VAWDGALTIWWFLLFSEEVFFRYNEDASLTGRFPQSAYAEAGFWAIASLALVITCLINGTTFTDLRSGAGTKLIVFGVICTVSVTYAVRPVYSIAWAAKLALVIGLVSQVAHLGKEPARVRQLLTVTLWAFLALATMRLARAVLVAGMSGTFAGGRIDEQLSPIVLSERAGLALLLALTLFVRRHQLLYLALGVISAMILVVGGGKTAIVAALLSCTTFVLLQRRAVGRLAAIAAVGLTTLAVLGLTPVGTYFLNYWQSDSLVTLTGRTNLWREAVPLIMQRPVLGHGFLSSKYIHLLIDIDWPAPHLHNCLLEVLYNTGLVGLGVFIALHWHIIKYLYWAIRSREGGGGVRDLAVGALVIYMNLTMNGLLGDTIGSRPNAPFMVFIALIPLSMILVREGEGRQDRGMRALKRTK
jgi:O-antigen ligase